MKDAKYRYYKARIEGGDGNPYRGISFSNRQLPMGLLDLLNEKMHEAIDKFNGKLEWRRTLVQFEHDGVKYEQYVLDGCKQPCLGCCFSQKKDGIGCQHPHYLDGSKGTCGYPYRVAPSTAEAKRLKDAIGLLAEHNRWRRAEGKYAEIGSKQPFSADALGQAIDCIVECLADVSKIAQSAPETDFADAGKIAEKSGKPTNLTWQDIQNIVEMADDDRLLQHCSDQNWSKEQYYSEVLKCFKEGK